MLPVADGVQAWLSGPESVELRVLYVVHYAVYGGPHNLMAELSAPLSQRGCTTLTILPDEQGSAAARLHASGVDVLPMPLSRVRATRSIRVQAHFAASLVGDVQRLRHVIRERRIDLVLVGGLVNPHAVLAARLEGLPVVWQVIDTRTPSMVVTALRPLMLHAPDALMFWGRALVEHHLGHRWPSCPVEVCFSPIDVERFREPSDGGEAARRRFGIPPGAPVVGVVGNLNPQKGVETFIAAAERVAAQRPDAHFLVIGSRLATHAQYVEGLERQLAAAAIKQDKFIWAGSIDDMESAYAAMSTLLCTSIPRSEGIPTVIGEAMACGVPVVTTRVGAAAEVVENGVNGFVVDPGNAAAIADRALPLLDDTPQRAAMVAAGHHFVSEQLSRERCADIHVDTFRSAIEHSARRRKPSRARLARKPRAARNDR